jgi:ornithine cyclodeaminase/alanine dehydrogenase-like protein (mu-crystallin family)
VPLLLRTSEVEPLLDLPQSMAILERAYRHQADGKLDESPPLRLMGRKIRLVAGGLPVDDRVGIRLSVGPGGGEGALALLYASSGKLLAVMGYPFSELRLSATLALAIERLAPPGARRAGLIGSGRLAPQALRAAAAVRPIASVAVYSPTPEHREAFAAREAAQLGIEVEPVPSPEQAIEDAPIVLVSTNSPAPTLLGRWLSSEQSVFGCGRPNEFDDEVYLRAGLIVVSSKLHEQGYYDTQLDRPLIRLTNDGALTWQEVAELGQLVAGQVRPNGMPVFRESQGGCSDVALASWAYQQALERGLGRDIGFE